MAEQWMSIVEYARTYAISDMTVRRRIKNGKLHAVLRDGKYYIPIKNTKQQSIIHTENQLPFDIDATNIQDTQPSESRPPLPNSSPRSTTGFEGARAKYPSHSYGMSHHYRQHGIPDNLKSNFQSTTQGVVDTQTLLRFCENSLARFSSIERHIDETYKARLQVLEERLKSKDYEIARLQQQVEDLQTLVNMLESSSNPK